MNSSNKQMSPQDAFFITSLAATAITNIVISLFAISRAKRLWKFVAALPILIIAAVGLNIVLGLSRDPTSHNLWPLEIALWSAVGIVISIALMLLRKVFPRSEEHNHG